MTRWTTLLLTLAVTLAACGHSPPTHFYTLSPVRSSAPEASAGDWHVTVGNVTLPATLDRQSMALRNGPNRLEVSDQARWAAPLDGMIRSTLADNLSQRFGKNVVLPPGDPVPSGPLTTVTLNLQHFIGSRDGTVVLDADWSAQDRRQKVLMTRHTQLSRQVDGSSIDAIVAAQSDMLGALSDDIARALAGGTLGQGA